jgi:exo-1,4-beta-D-glucosaminidase
MHAKRSIRRTFSFMMALLIVLTAFPLAVGASDREEHGDRKDRDDSKDTYAPASAVTLNKVFALKDNWQIQSSAVAADDGATVSKTGFGTNGWYNTTVPNTVMGALVNAGDIQNPYYADTIAQIDDNRFKVPWWYRTEFTLPASEKGKRILLNFQGINYKADIWVNGHLAASAKDVVGAFRTYEIDVTDFAIADGKTKNTVAVQVTRPDYVNDLTIYWVDWVPRPPDNNMGLWRDVFVTTTDSVKTRSPFVISKVDNDLSTAHLSAYVDLSNAANRSVAGELTATNGR